MYLFTFATWGTGAGGERRERDDGMQNALLHGELGFTYPDSFSAMSPEQLKQAYGMDYADMWGMRDEENHVVFTVIWKDSHEFLHKLASSASLAKRAEKALSKSFRKQGYACSGFFTREVAGQEATGFGYSYEIQGITQSCETIVVQHGKCCYTLYYYTRSELAEANRAMYDALLASLSFA